MEAYNSKNRILLVEDEEHLRDTIKLNLDLEGYDVEVASDGRKALEDAGKKHFDLLILDIMLPEIDGFQVCETIRLQGNQVPILILSAKGNIKDKVKGLKLGADDYLSKPFDLEEFLLRVKALLKRIDIKAAYEPGEGLFSFGKNTINFLTYEVVNAANEKRLLSKREILLLKFLVDRKCEVVSREQILNSVWGYDVYPSTRTIDNYILAFRKYFENDPKNPIYFISIRGVGYKFVN